MTCQIKIVNTNMDDWPLIVMGVHEHDLSSYFFSTFYVYFFIISSSEHKLFTGYFENEIKNTCFIGFHWKKNDEIFKTNHEIVSILWTIVSFGSSLFRKTAPLLSTFIDEYLESEKIAQ